VAALALAAKAAKRRAVNLVNCIRCPSKNEEPAAALVMARLPAGHSGRLIQQAFHQRV
jgi:hypothetical protein